jgi:hypothetical protein
VQWVVWKLVDVFTYKKGQDVLRCSIARFNTNSDGRRIFENALAYVLVHVSSIGLVRGSTRLVVMWRDDTVLVI